MMVNPADPALSSALADATERGLAEAEIRLPPDVLAALRRAAAAEKDEIARRELGNILENIALAEERQVPICQDTGVPVVYLTLPPDVPFSPALFEGVREGVQRATAAIPLRPNVVDPLTRENTNDNTGVGMPAVHVTPGERLTVTVLPKGAGSENVSRIGMLLPSQAGEIPRFVAETMLLAGGKPCPPVILGVGIGGTFDMAAALAKEALLLPVDTMDDYEQELCDAVNALGIGPMGLGGDTTALAVKVKRAGCHTASLPVAVNVQCWACRRATVEVKR
ncbi:L(+)-tartrate dehydratase subunit alpha [Methanoculleus chikugoensis]|jgi:fumarate hydratase subunit alpha|uniref:L(+)-tartrate dehydratase subunit alpha n=1 Tax=Methanoculleus chikugoensis TaxID=118126 RepID=A0A1M4MJT0_9EURY|nr:fumarate hydratase [Methanoculleus chikugoensis]SCL75107.1 L(+)-tartrate dehydratase subunit alpha [Methanoculleus chikugoensis]